MEIRLLTRVSLLGFFAVATLCAFAGQSRAAEPGVVSDLTWYISDVDKQRTAVAMQDLGSRWTRIAIQWKEAEPAEGRYDEWWLKEYGKAIDMANAAGQRVIVMVDTAPAWASGSASSNVPQDPADFARFMGFIADRYEGKVDAWEVWNEPNLSRFWSTGPNPGAYAALLRAAYPALKQADPNALVVFAGTSGNDYAFLEGAYAAGAKGSFDVLGTHPYPYCGSTSPAEIRMSGSRISKDSFLGYREMRKTMLAEGDDKPIWITEMGWTTTSGTCNPGAGVWQGGVTEALQADYLHEAFKLVEADPYVHVALWYNIRNNYWLKDGDQPEARYGLMRTDFTPKPAYGAFKAYATGQPYTPYGQPYTPYNQATRPKRKPKPKTSTRTVLRLDQPAPGATTTKAAGRVSRAQKGTVHLLIQARKGKRWRTVRRTIAKIGQKGRYRKRLRKLPRIQLRARAVFPGTFESRPSRSRYVRLGLDTDVSSRRR